MLTNVDQTGHSLAAQHSKTSSRSRRRISTNHSQTLVDVNGEVADNPTTRDLLSPSYKCSTSDSPYHHDDQLSNADSGIRSGSYYEKTSIADSAIVAVSDCDDRESSPESGIRLVPPQHEKMRSSPKSSTSSHHPPIASQSSSSLQRVQSNISPSAIHPVTISSLSQANNSPRHHRLSVPSYLSSSPHPSLAWEAPHTKSTVIVVTHTGKEVSSDSSKGSHQSSTENNAQHASTQPDAGYVTEDANNTSSDSDRSSSNDGDSESDNNVPRCVDIAWPTSWKRRIVYPFLFPLIILLYFTLPNVNKPVSDDNNCH